MKPTREYLQDVRQRWKRAPKDAKRQVIEEAGLPYGYCYSHMTRLLKLRVRTRSLPAEVKERLQEAESNARKVFDFKTKADYGQNNITIRQAYLCLKENNELPEELTLKQVYTTARRIGLTNEYKSPAKKFTGRSAPLHLVMVDYSKSDYFHFTEHGTITMEPPLVTKRFSPRLYIAAAVDQYSRVCWFRYYMTEGESTAFVRDALLDAFGPKETFDKTTGEIAGYRAILQGIPRELYTDRGPGNLSEQVATGLLKLDIQHIIGSVETDISGRVTNRSNKKARGMIEKFIGDFKRNFEGQLWLQKLLGKTPVEFTLRDLNDRALHYCEEINQLPHPLLTNAVRWNLFSSALTSLRFPPEEAKTYFGGWLPRTVQRRLIRGHQSTRLFIAPNYIRDGQKVDVLFSAGEAFMFHEHKLVKLQPQGISIHEVLEKEVSTDHYSDALLKHRLAEEIELQSEGTLRLRDLSEPFKDDIKEFLERPRLVSEIKDKAAYFVMTKASKKPNIIRYRKR